MTQTVIKKNIRNNITYKNLDNETIYEKRTLENLSLATKIK